MSVEKKLEVRDLTISFRTSGGKVQAVRDISFDLYKGETLAIVGESGSGKSVTSRAILGISAGNALIEGGEIIYDGKDLLKISEEDFHAIRGDKIAMVFQDPLSSLNPIMRIGKQLTEAMILKNRANRRESSRRYQSAIRELSRCIEAAGGARDAGAHLDEFRALVRMQAALEAPYDYARENARAAAKCAQDLLLAIEKDAVTDAAAECRELIEYSAGSIAEHVVDKDAARLKALLTETKNAARAAKRKKGCQELQKAVSELLTILEAALDTPEPDFLALAWYMGKNGKELPDMPMPELNRLAQEALETGFMAEFRRLANTGVRYSHEQKAEARKEAGALIDEKLPQFEAETLDKNSVYKTAEALAEAVEKAIDRLATVKDSHSYTFRVSLKNALDSYFDGLKKNEAEKKRFEKQSKKHQKLTARGKKPEWQVAPLSLVDEKLARENAAAIIKNLSSHYSELDAAEKAVDFDAKTEALIGYLRQNAVGEVHRVSRSMAKDSAIRLMESVGISEARKRYRQYPFEFSGGMRQRIVIAISLTANPDVLICDEPTTALDVTIQAQILELINDLKKKRNLSVIFITHDLGVVANMADRIAVMYAGKIVEYGSCDDVFYSPAHPYTWALLSSVPDLNTNERLESIPGTPPNMIYPPKGDAFAQRNKYAMEIDFEQQPPMFKISDSHYAATWLLHPNAPKVQPPAIVTERIARMTKGGGASS